MTAETIEGPTDEVLFEQRGRVGVITLNRPKAVNALNAGMVGAMLERLAAWAEDDGVATVLVQGSGERGLCAGGDIAGHRATPAQGSREGPPRRSSARAIRRPGR